MPIDYAYHIVCKVSVTSIQSGSRIEKQVVVQLDTFFPVYILDIKEHFNDAPNERRMENHSLNVPIDEILRKVQENNLVFPTAISR